MAEMNEQTGTLNCAMLEVDGRSLRVAIKTGAAHTVPVLLLNGIGMPLETMIPLAHALSPRGVILFDVPGVGGSPVPGLPLGFPALARLAVHLLDRLDLVNPIDIVGFSWGGALAQQLALSHPERCRSLVLAATTAGVTMVPGRWSALANLFNPSRFIPSTLVGDFVEPLDQELSFGAEAWSVGIGNGDKAGHIPATNGLGYYYQFLAGLGWTSLPWLHRINTPTLVLGAEEDSIASPLNARMLAALIPQASLEMLPGGHSFLYKNPKMVAQHIMHFLDQVA